MRGLRFEILGYHETTVRVRFGEVDGYGYLWHGHTLSFFECLRMDLARGFGLRSADLADHEVILPMLEATSVYKNPSFEDDELIIQGTVLRPVIECPFLVFIYRAVKRESGDEVFRGRTRQVLMQPNGRMFSRPPEPVRGRLAEMWSYLARQPGWSDSLELVRSFANVGDEHVVCP